jgi:SAM-dependent methyltransferase
VSRSAEWPIAAPGVAFDHIAESYDEVFTRSVVGRAQRAIVWKILAEIFHAGDRILELNCGTGEDALFLGRRGVAVEGCDASEQMIEVARRRKMLEGPELAIQFRQLPTEDIGKLRVRSPFDGALSNFSGLNCVGDLDHVGSDLSALVRKGGNLVFCLSNRICLWELIWFGVRGDLRQGGRRVRGSATGRLGERSVHVWYPTSREIERALSPWFRLLSSRAVGLLVPPSYLEFWASKHPRAISRMADVDRALGDWPVLRGLGDHLLLRFERVQ